MTSERYVCPECGLDYGTVSPGDTVVAVRSFPRRFAALLHTFGDDEDVDALVRRRPGPSTWSALEYTAHVRDMFGLMADTVRRMTVEDRPTIKFWDPDHRAEEERYAEQDPAVVVDELGANAERLAQALGRVEPDDWRRTAHFDWGDRDLLTMARNAVHEGAHHRRDVERALDSVRGRP